jgi:signal transduction histidine kinase
MDAWRRFITVPSTDPDDARRRQLLNIVLAGFGGLAVIGLAATTYLAISGVGGASTEIGILYLSELVFLAGAIILYFINRYWSGLLASSLLVILLSILFAFIDSPEEVVHGRSLVAFAIPIALASVLLPAYASFLVAGLCSLIIAAVASTAPGVTPDIPAMLAFFAMALVSWLSGRGLEHALRELRSLNRELDQRVVERTRELSQALAREQEESDKNEAILHSIADGVVVFDDEAKAVVVNPAMSLLLNKPASEIAGKDIGALMAGTVAAVSQEAVWNLFKSRTALAPINIEWGKKTLSLSVAPLHGEGETAGGSVAVFRDVTREAEVSRMKSAFVSMVSHELRTPISAIQGYAEMMQQRVYGPLTEKQHNASDRIMANTKRLMGIVSDLLDQAQVEAGTIKIDDKLFSPVDLVEAVREVVAKEARSKELHFTAVVESGLPERLRGDPHRLHQVLANLTMNAIKYTEEGEVNVRLYRPDPSRWAMEVCDTGPGIPLSAQSYIFEPFRQIDSSMGRKYGGVGLGLSIVKKLVALMGGEIKLESQMERGSKFTVLLPVVVPEPTTA